MAGFWGIFWIFCIAVEPLSARFCPRGLSDGVMVAQRSLEPLVMVRIHVGQPLLDFLILFLLLLDFFRLHTCGVFQRA
ncbi:MAG: hypothetical protein RI897_1692 [Verrucomicrobiota bacterium]